MSTAAVSQLVAKGRMDTHLTTDATVTYFRNQHFRHTNFSLENQLLEFDSGPDINSTKSTVTLQRTGDLANRMFVVIELPGLANVGTCDVANIPSHFAPLGDMYPLATMPTSASVVTTGSCACEAVEFGASTAYLQGGGVPLWGSTSAEATVNGVTVAAPRAQDDACVAYWCPSVGYRMVKSAELQIGSTPIEKVYSDFMYMYEELSQRPLKSLGEMIGESSSDQDAMAKSKMARRLHVPLPFTCTKSASSSLPIVSLQFHQVKVIVEWNDLASCIVNASGIRGSPVLSYTMKAPDASPDQTITLTTVVRKGEDKIGNRSRGGITKYGYVSSDVANPLVVTQAPSTPITAADIRVRFEAMYVFLDADERKKFSTGSFQMLMSEATQIRQDETNRTSVEVSLDFNHSIIELMWAVRQTSNSDKKDWFNYGGVVEPVTGITQDAIKTVSLTLNNAHRFSQDTDGAYFRTIQPHQHHSAIPDAYVYSYSFALHPEGHENPSGSCNFSRIDSKKLYLNLDPALFTDNTLVGGSDLSNNKVDIMVFARSHNLLRIVKGLGGKAFA